MRKLLVLLVLGVLGWQASAQGPEGPSNVLTAQEQKEGWKLLFDGKSLDGWRIYKKKDTGNWMVKDGAIFLAKGSGDLMTVDKFSNFEFQVDWKFGQGNNSGIIYRISEEGGPSWSTGPEMQVMNHGPKDKLGKTSGGSLYDLYEPASNPFKPADQWNTFKVVANGKHLEHWVNGVKVVDCDIGSDDWNARLAKSKWKTEKLFASQATGHIALQDHGGQIAFRNIKVRILPDSATTK